MNIYLSANEIKELDRRATEEFGISTETLMENAGRAVAKETIKFLQGYKWEWKILVLCGGGNNGGDGLVTARLLYEQGVSVTVLLFKNSIELKEPNKTNFQKIKKAAIPCLELPTLQQVKTQISKSDLLIDALFGIGLNKEVKEPFRQVIEEMNASNKAILAIDVPSGLNADTGLPQGHCVRATMTVSMGVLKKGFSNESSKKWTGKIVLADIGYPKELITRITAANS